MLVQKIAGVDEVGRGPLAGPVISAAVILNPASPILGLKDSKKLTKNKREVLTELIKEHALCFAFGRAEVEEIDKINILQASLLAMKRAVMNLSIEPTHVLVDGNHCPNLTYSTEAIIQGDAFISEISAASILAKVHRDQEMEEWDKCYPGYGFLSHKGYPTKQHVEALKQLGPTPIHRRSFNPVSRIIKESHYGK